MCGAGGEVKDVRLQWCMGIMCWCSPAQRGMRLLIILATPRIMAIEMRWRQYVLKADCSPLVPPVAETALSMSSSREELVDMRSDVILTSLLSQMVFVTVEIWTPPP